MRQYPVPTPVFVYHIDNWEDNKKKILAMIDPLRGKENIDTEVYTQMKKHQHEIPQADDRISRDLCGTEFDTDFFSDKLTSNKKVNPLPLYAHDLMQILKPYINEFKEESTIHEDYHIMDLWYETCMRDQYHGLHDHGQKGISAVLYVEFPDGSIPTQFRDEYDNSKWYTADVKEGDLILWPAWWKHRGGANPTDERRTIIGFNMHRKGAPKSALKARDEREYYYTSLTCHC
tara:strand:+ start:20700 stop:21395 length:696 start_codon:yes stop_codon:yes gene_type:complete